ncbi:MAG: hypothetical protein D3916_13440 [Candidatus Electrothrix sp. MAN1_4]|nr:hypothetical protein [Candidatus Electrothrix sp. MAN1_4]
MKKHIRFDWAIKRLLRQKANFGILEGFLSELLKEDVKINEKNSSKQQVFISLLFCRFGLDRRPGGTLSNKSSRC